jgi:hypothetical protein
MTTGLQLREKRPRVNGTPDEHRSEANFDEIWAEWISEDVFAETSLFDITQANQVETTSDVTTGTPTSSKKRCSFILYIAR